MIRSACARKEGELINSMVDELNGELSHEFSLKRPAMTSEPVMYDESLNVIERLVMMGGSHQLTVDG
jgi:hypothetical protein